MGIAPISLICAAGPGAQSCYRTLNNGLNNVTSNYVAQVGQPSIVCVTWHEICICTTKVVYVQSFGCSKDTYISSKLNPKSNIMNSFGIT